MKCSPWRAFVLSGVALLSSVHASAEPVAVRYREGLVHGFLTLRSVAGVLLASGDLTQHARGDQVTTRLTFKFRDGSTHDQTTVYSQKGTFRLVTDHLVQKGPAFAQPLDMSIDAASGRVTVRYKDEHGKEQVESERLDLPDDVSNGMVLTLLKNTSPGGRLPTLSYVAATPKPRLVKLAISIAGTESFSTAGMARKASHYVLKVELGGIAGLLAPILGKQPPDTHVWVMGGDTPAFVRSEGPFFNGGDPWRIELSSPVFPK